MSMTRNQLIERAKAAATNGELLQTLARRVSWRTESDGPRQPQAAPELTGYLQEEIGPDLQAMGFEIDILPNPEAGHGPFLLARRIEGTHLPTLLTYAHGDVVNGQEAAWRSGLSPWTLTPENGLWYGRGTADNKGQHTVLLTALAHTLQARQNQLGYNLTLLMEMGEEAGSPGLARFCQEQRERLSANLFVACDGPRVQAERPTLFLGSRGACNFSLQVNARSRAYHSGNWGGVLSNPAMRLSHALACLVDAQGRIRIPALLPPTPTPDLRHALSQVPVGGGPDDPTLTPGWGEPGLSAAERLVAWNTLEVLALGSGSVNRPINAIPASATAQCQLRFVVGTDEHRIVDHIRHHLAAHGFGDVEVTAGMSCPATRLNLDNPWVHWALHSMQTSAGVKPVLLPNLAGSLPNDVFANILGLPTLWIPHSHPSCNQHAPNEHMLASVAQEGLAIMAGLFWDLGEPGHAPWTGASTSPEPTTAH